MKRIENISPRRVRTLHKYRLWASDVYTRDEFTCQRCFKKINNPAAHHIRELLDIIEENEIKTIEEANECEELWNVNNGITLCRGCHVSYHNRKGQRPYRMKKVGARNIHNSQ